MRFILNLLSKVFTSNQAVEIDQLEPSKTWQDEVAKVIITAPKTTHPVIPIMHMGGDPTVNGNVLRETEFTKKSIITDIIAVEGGYVNHSSDLGGETNFGITYATANKVSNKKMLTAMGWDGKMRNLTQPMAYAIYDVEFWTKLNLDAIFEISPFLADKLFDQGVNCGPARAAKWLQRALNGFNRGQKDYKDLTVDGGIGNDTLIALNGLIQKRGRAGAVTVLLYAIVSFQGNHYLTIAEEREANEEFMYGWFMERLSHNLRLYFDKK